MQFPFRQSGWRGAGTEAHFLGALQLLAVTSAKGAPTVCHLDVVPTSFLRTADFSSHADQDVDGASAA